MKTIQANLTGTVVSSYDSTKTTIAGRVFSKTINSQTVLGPPLTRAIDVFTDTSTGGSITGLVTATTTNGNMFIFNAISAGVGSIVLYTFSIATGTWVHIGRIQYNMPNSAATTHTIRSVKVDDSGATFKIWITTIGTVPVNAGQFLIFGTTAADFVPVGFATIPLATSSSQKAVYFLQDSGALGNAHVMTTAVGSVLPVASTNVAVNKKCYVHNGTAAVHQYYVFDGNVAPTITPFTGVSITLATPGVVSATAHGFITGDQIVFTAGTIAAPLVLGTVYFVSSTGNTANSFQVSTTLALASAGTSVNTTTAGSGLTLMRAYGITGALFSLKTGNLTAAAGTLLATNSESFALPAHTTNATFDCIFFATTTSLYLGRIADLTSGATSWPTLVSSNVTGTGSDITAPTPTFAAWSNFIDTAFYATPTTTFVQKQVVNGVIKNVFGGQSNQYIEGNNPTTLPFALFSLTDIQVTGGWLFAVGSAIGQRVVLAMDVRSDDSVGYSYIISKVLATPQSIARAIHTYEQLFDYTDSMNFYYRTAATAGDATFSTATGGWIAISTAKDLSAVALNSFTQIKIGFQIMTLTANTPSQINEILLTVTTNSEISENWVGSSDNSTSNGASPAYTAFRLTTAYSTSVPTMYFRSYDDSGNLVASANTAANPTLFQYSSNNGTSWSALGTIPNTPLTTELRYIWASPPGVRVTSSLKES